MRTRTEDVVELWERRVREEGVQQGLAEGHAQTLIAVYEARFGKMPSKLRSVILGTRDDATLRGWDALMATHSAEEIAAALRKRPRR
jgi:hypothetical protein